MDADHNQTPLNPQVGKVVTRVEKFQARSGQVFEIRWTDISTIENGIHKKESYFAVFPPLMDNRTPDSVADVRECCVCLGLYHRESVIKCPVCGGDFCQICMGKIVENEIEIMACAACAKKNNRGLLGRIFNRLWTLED